MPAKMPESKRVGQSRRMNCGIMATCVAYRNNRDADFRFEDGSAAMGKTWGNFMKGKIMPPAGKTAGRRTLEKMREKYVGMPIHCDDGLTATCIAYQGAKNLTIRWPDGKTQSGIRLDSFLKGSITKDGKKTLEKTIKERVGQSKKMGNGHTATCTAYRDSTDADFEFEDGSAVTGRHWQEFMDGYLKPPNAKQKGNGKKEKLREKYVGMSVPCSNGLTATCTSYGGSGNITIQWPDGTVHSGTNTRTFQQGRTRHPLYPAEGKRYGQDMRIGCVIRKKIAYKCQTANYYCQCTICGFADIMDWKEIHAHNASHGIPAEHLTWQYIQKHKERG